MTILVLAVVQIINLDLLDTIGASHGTEELKQEIKKQVGCIEAKDQRSCSIRLEKLFVICLSEIIELSEICFDDCFS